MMARSIQGWVLVSAAAGLMLIVLLSALVPVLGLLMLLVPLGVVVFLAMRAQRERAIQQRIARLWELAMLRHYRETLRRAWGLLPEVRSNAELHLRCIAVIAHTLDDLAQHESAIVAFDYLIERLPPTHPMALQLRVQRAAALLCDDRLADGDDALRKLRGTIEQLPPGPIPAGYQLAQLVQDVRTGHFEHAAQNAQNTAKHLWPLGIDAGFGYGLLAYCQHQNAQRNSDTAAAQQQRDDAKKYWQQATLLIPPAALAHRHHELRAMLTLNNDPQA